MNNTAITIKMAVIKMAAFMLKQFGSAFRPRSHVLPTSPLGDLFNQC